MRGYVHTINRRRGLVAVQAAAGFTIVEILGSEPIGLGDWLEWQDNCLGGLVYRNLSKAADHRVIVRAQGVHPDWVRLLLQL
jgi:hypothetical protein